MICFYVENLEDEESCGPILLSVKDYRVDIFDAQLMRYPENIFRVLLNGNQFLYQYAKLRYGILHNKTNYSRGLQIWET
jgi:hypothetical protein